MSFFNVPPDDPYRAEVERIVDVAERKVDAMRRERDAALASAERWKIQHFHSLRALNRHRDAWLRARDPKPWQLRRALAQAVWERDRAEAAVEPLRAYRRATAGVGYDTHRYDGDSRRVMDANRALNEATGGWDLP